MWIITQAVINGLLMGGVYSLVAVGLTIIFGVMKMINFAQGEFLMLGMYITWVFSVATSASPFELMLPVTLAMIIIGFVVFKLFMQPLIGRDNTSFILLTVGLAFFLENLIMFIWGGNFYSIDTAIKDAAIKLGEYSMALPRVIACLVVFLLVFMVSLLLRKTNLGRAMRATSENREVAQMLGIDTMRTFAIAFVMGIALAAIAGLLMTPMYYIHPKIGASFKVTAMTCIVLGGLGSISGAMIGGFIAGLVESLIGTLLDFNLAPAGIFVILILVLYFKPQGLFGKKERVA